MRFCLNKKNILILLFILLGAVLTFSSSSLLQKEYPLGEKGVLDLTNWDFKRDGTVRLDGEWEFYWNQLLTYDDFYGNNRIYKPSGYFKVPKVWNRYEINGEKLPALGYGTYRLKVKVDDAEDLKGLKILTMSTSYKLMIDDKIVAQSGIVGEERESSKSEYNPQIALFNTNSKDFDIIIQVSNYTYSKGGIWHSIVFGTSEQIINMREASARREMFLFGIMLIILFYHIAIYWLHRKNKSVLYFILILFIFTIRILFTGEYFITKIIPGMDFNYIVFIEYMTNYWGPTIWMMFVCSIFPKEFSKKVLWASVFISLVFTIITVFTNVKVYTSLLIYLEILSAVMFIYTLYCTFIAALKRKEEGVLLFIGMIIILAAFINDVLYFRNIIKSYPGGVFGFSMALITFIHAYILAERFSDAFNEVEKLSDEMISLNKLKDEFLENTSHELRTPLHGIINITESILQCEEGHLSSKQRENLSLITLSGKRLANLVNDILDYSKLKYDDIKLNKKSVDIQKTVQMVLDVYRYIAVNKSIKFNNNIPENIPLIFADEQRVTQIVYNFIENAIKFIPQGEITISAIENNNMLEIYVEDTGIGIPEDKLEDIFKSFEQVQNSLMRGYSETGLGLSITKYLVEMHGGKIWVESKPGKGSKFIFSMPISNGISVDIDKDIKGEGISMNNNMYSQYTNTQGILHQEGEFTILIVDDDYINLQSLVNILSTEKYSIIPVADGIEALDLISENRTIDLVILDVMMPKISGFEVCKKIREENSLYDLPVIMLTSQSNPKAILAGLEVGANDFLLKPFAISELKARVKTLLQLKKSVQHALNSEMAFLQAQIKPHFLYNALNTIISFCWTDGEKAGELILELSNYLRSSFEFNNMDKFIYIEKEIEFIESYLAIEKARFEEKLNCHFDFEEQDLNFMIPTLLLQPIVENAIKHGVLQNENGGDINITIRHKDEFIILKVMDNGVGIPKEKLLSIISDEGENTRVGIKNINKRMKRIYGYGIDIESEVGKGTVVTIKIPKQRGESFA
jgi:signal transduction histidine kinase